MPGISFLSPLFLIAAIAAAVPIFLHLFHRRTEVVIDFPAVRLLKRVPTQQHRRRRLRELILLALRVAALVLLAVSFARPYVAGAVAPPSAPVTVVALDTSMSLSAPGQFERARKAATQALEDAPASHVVALVTFADAAQIVVAPTTDRGAAAAAIARAVPGAGGTRYRTALARVTEAIGERDGRVVIVTDLQQAGWETNEAGGLPDGIEFEVAGIAPPAANLAVTSAERRDRRVLATVQNYGREAAALDVRLMANGKELARAPIKLAALAAADVELSGAIPSSGGASVVIDDAAGYQADNTRFLVLDPPPAVPMAALVADPAGATGGIYVERALSVAGRGREFRVEVVDGREFSTWSREKVAAQAALIVLGTRTLDRTGRDLAQRYLAGGGQVLLALGPDVDTGTLPSMLGIDPGAASDPERGSAATLIPADSRHPIFRPFLMPSGALADVQVDQHRRLKEQAGRMVLARFSGGDAALTEQNVGQGRLLMFTSDLDNQWSRFPLNPAFVPFVVETARYLTKGRQQRRDWVLPDVPPGVAASPGVAAIEPGTPRARWIAVNPDVKESSLATVAVEEFTSAVQRMARMGTVAGRDAARDLEDRQRWWQVGLLVMLAALAGEALVGRRAT